MHNEIRDFFGRMYLKKPGAFKADKVLECGSFDINGNPRPFFPQAKEYVGLDWRPGPQVDVVSLVHEYKDKPNGYFDFVIATSLLEHDPHWVESIERMCQLLAIGGALLITCGGPGFHEHEIDTSPGYEVEEPGNVHDVPAGTYYANRTATEIVTEVTRQARFIGLYLEDDPSLHDIRLFAFGKMPVGAGLEVIR